ncbi:TIR domain-containing protein [Spiroplasma endosymbiont of Colias croceus]|uniref:TIR domain-containing protein n=1 Tax=Spiroplasma endosymbiont of Colias croceus TaxID=3066310 RepID=UPI0030D008EF
MRKIFISYHHLREQEEKNQLAELIKKYANYLNIKDMSVEIGDIDTTWSNNKIAKTIRENHLKDTTITILILGIHTKCRQHIDWEIEASLNKYGSLNRRKKINSFIILLTADFIKKAKTNCNFNNTCDYSSLITQENAGQRIYETVINKHAIIATYDEIFSDIIILKNLLDKVQSNHKKEEMFYQNVISPSFLKPTVLKDNTKDTVFNEKKEIDNAILSSNKDNGFKEEDSDIEILSESDEEIDNAKLTSLSWFEVSNQLQQQETTTDFTKDTVFNEKKEIDNAKLTSSQDSGFNEDDDSDSVVASKSEEKIDNAKLTSSQDSGFNEDDDSDSVVASKSEEKIDNAKLTSSQDSGFNEDDDSDSVVASKSEEKIDNAKLTSNKDNDFNKDDDSDSVVASKSEEKINNVILTSSQDSEINNQLLQEITMDFTKDDNKSNLLRKLSLKHNSKDSGIGSERQEISILKDENFKRIHLHKKDNSEECEAKEKSEKTMQEFNKKTKKFINSGKINYTQECPEIYLSYL